MWLKNSMQQERLTGEAYFKLWGQSKPVMRKGYLKLRPNGCVGGKDREGPFLSSETFEKAC